MTFFSFVAFNTATFASRCVSVNGPFLTDLPIISSQLSAFSTQRSLSTGLADSGQLAADSFLLPLLALPRHNPLVGALVIARLESASGLAPRCHRVPAAGRLALAAAMRMVHRVHRHAAVVRRLAQPPCAAR